MTAAPTVSIDLVKLLADTQLPALPQVATRILELARDEANGPAEFAVPIDSDPGLAGQVLRFVNSSYFGFSREISSVRLAITLVGARAIKNFVLWNAVFSLVPDPKCGPFDLKGLWRDSLRRALFARRYAELLGVNDAEEAFSAALLQDMAVPILAKQAPRAYEKLLDARRQGRVRLSQLERQVFGWTHAEAAGTICRLWHLPENFALLVENHPALDVEPEATDLGASRLAVTLSALLPVSGDDAWDECDQLQRHYRRTAPPDAPPLVDLLAEIDCQFEELAPFLKLSGSIRTLVDLYRATAAVSS